MSQAHAADSSKASTPPKTPPFTMSLEPQEAQALLAIVGLSRGSTLYPLYSALEDFHAANGIERKDVSEPHDIRGFDEDNLIDWWTAEEVRDSGPVSAA